MLAIQLPEGERELANVAFRRESPMAIGITDRAVYIAESKWRPFRKEWRIRRIPIEQVRRVSVRRMRPGLVLLLSLMLIAVGAVHLYVMLHFFRESREVSLWPFLTIGAGLILPFTARGRRIVHIEFAAGEPWIWRPPMLAADMTKRHVDWLIEQIVKGFRSQRTYVHEE
jgi:hypothetical protein